MGAEDIGRIDDFSKLNGVASKLPNVKTVIPMGIDLATVTSQGELDRALAALRDAVRSEDASPVADLIVQIKEILSQMKAEQEANRKIAKNRAEVDQQIARIVRALSDEFWASFEQDPLAALEFLDTKVAPLSEEGRLIYFRYVGTDLERFVDNFERFELVDGEMVPPNKRGFLFNQKFYEKQVKHFFARNIDEIHTSVVEEGKTIAGDPLLQALVRQTVRQYRRITYQLDPKQSATLEKQLREKLPDVKGDLAELIQSFLTLTDDNLERRYAPVLRADRARDRSVRDRRG